MAGLRDPKGSIAPEDGGAYRSSCQATADLGPEKPQFPARQVLSPKRDHFRPNNRKADSHPSQVHSHLNQFHTTRADGRLTGCDYGSRVNSASQVKLWLQPSRSSNLSAPAELKNSPRFIPYYNSSKLPHSIPKPSELDCHPETPSKPRKRTVILKPKYPKYEGLSNFAAPVDLVSGMIPGSSDNNLDQSSPPSAKSVSSDKMSWESNTDSTNTDSHPAEESSQTPVDFLKYLDFDDWDRRKQDLSQMVEDRKNLFLRDGFAETSGKAFQPDEQAIDKKPIPNRWVWYMHLSTDYDKLRNTRVPPGGPAGYLKYGWDRLGPAGKQPYQELADIYSAQRLKYMAEHGITEDSTKKKPKHIEKLKSRRQSSHELMIRAEHNPRDIGLMAEQLSPEGKIATLSPNESIERELSGQRPNFHIDIPFVPIQPILQYNLLYQQLNPFVHEKLDWNYSNGPGDVFEMTESTSCPSYLRSPELPSDYFSPFYNDAGYGGQSSSDPIQPLSTPLGLPSSPTEYSFGCYPGSMFPYQAPSELQARYTLSPDSIHSTHSDLSGILPSSGIDNGLGLTSFGSLAPSNPFYEPFEHQEIDFPALNPGNVHSEF